MTSKPSSLSKIFYITVLTFQQCSGSDKINQLSDLPTELIQHVSSYLTTTQDIQIFSHSSRDIRNAVVCFAPVDFNLDEISFLNKDNQLEKITPHNLARVLHIKDVISDENYNDLIKVLDHYQNYPKDIILHPTDIEQINKIIFDPKYKYYRFAIDNKYLKEIDKFQSIKNNALKCLKTFLSLNCKPDVYKGIDESTFSEIIDNIYSKNLYKSWNNRYMIEKEDLDLFSKKLKEKISPLLGEKISLCNQFLKHFLLSYGHGLSNEMGNQRYFSKCKFLLPEKNDFIFHFL